MTGAYPDEEIRDITPDYFRVLETPLLKGRFFTEADTADSPPVVIVNQAFVKNISVTAKLSVNVSHGTTQIRNGRQLLGCSGDIMHRSRYGSSARAICRTRRTRPEMVLLAVRRCARRAHTGPHRSGRIAQR